MPDKDTLRDHTPALVPVFTFDRRTCLYYFADGGPPVNLRNQFVLALKTHLKRFVEPHPKPHSLLMHPIRIATSDLVGLLKHIKVCNRHIDAGCPLTIQACAPDDAVPIRCFQVLCHEDHPQSRW